MEYNITLAIITSFPKAQKYICIQYFLIFFVVVYHYYFSSHFSSQWNYLNLGQNKTSKRRILPEIR